MQDVHPNIKAMAAATDRWIQEASAEPNAGELLSNRADWIMKQSALASAEGETPPHLEGLSAWDFCLAAARLSSAALLVEVAS